MNELRVLLIEDAAGAKLLLRELHKGGLAFLFDRVETLAELDRALGEFAPDVILADYSILGFEGMGGTQALERARERSPGVPFLFVSGTIGEEGARDALREGATDHVQNNNRSRLVPAIERALLEVDERRARVSAESERDDSARCFELFMQHLPGAAFIKDLEGRYTYINAGGERVLGKPASELIGSRAEDVLDEPQASESLAQHRAVIESGEAQSDVMQIETPQGSRSFLAERFPIPDASGKPALVGAIAIDLTETISAIEARTASEERFSSIAEATHEWIWETDREGRYTFCSPAAEAITGQAPESLVGRSSLELIDAPARDGAARALRLAVAEKRGWRDFVLRLRHIDGSMRWVDSNALPLLDAAGEVIGFRGAARDVSERIGQQKRIARLSRIQAVRSEINSAIIRIRDRAELFRDACRIAVEHGGFKMAWIGLADAGASRVRPVAWHGDDDGYLAEVGLALGDTLDDAGIGGLALRETRSIVVNDVRVDPRVVFRAAALKRGYRAMIALPLLMDAAPVGVMLLFAAEAGFFTDDERKLLDDLAADISFALDHIAKGERLAYVSYYDALTGLPNRQLFFERLAQLIQARKDEDSPVAVLVIDIDRFGYINRSMGRGAGDQLLVEFARRLRDAFSESTIPARISGGRFAMAVDGLGAAALALHIESGMVRSLAEPVVLGGVAMHVTAKVGIALFPLDGDTTERLFMNAEAAVQRAKDAADNYVFYAPELNAEVAQRMQLENRLRQAVDKREFVLHYQPKVDLTTRRIVGVEALIRWLDPERGLIPPLDFIPLLEETGLIVDVGRWVIGQAVSDLAAWRAEGLQLPRVAVNVSQAQVGQKDFVATVLAALDGERGGIDFEITESLMMAEGEAHIAKLQALRASGVHIHMDDFGTGQSSLAQIARLPLDALKIDRSFVIGMTEGNEHMAIVSMVLSLARVLKLQTVAEGVETEEQAGLLQSLGCDQGQGYLFCRPVAADALRTMLAA